MPAIPSDPRQQPIEDFWISQSIVPVAFQSFCYLFLAIVLVWKCAGYACDSRHLRVAFFPKSCWWEGLPHCCQTTRST